DTCQPLDEGLAPLMCDQDVISAFKFVLDLEKIEVYIETGVSLVEMHLMKGMMSHGKGVVIEEIMDDNEVKEAIEKEVASDGGRRINDAYMFRNLLEEIDFELVYVTEIMKWKLSQEKLSQEEVIGELNETFDNIIDKLIQDHVEMPSEAVEQRMNDHVHDEIDGVIYDTNVDASISGKEGDLETWMWDEMDQRDNEFDWKQDTYHGDDEVVEILDLFVG
nr:hypothetical protein [Tanacetum cinerariifolium]